MYLQHFQLKEFPFGITPDTGFFFSSETSQQALNTLLVATRAGEGLSRSPARSARARRCAGNCC